jgi:hypothetical protein
LRRDPVARYLGHHPGKSGFHQHEMVAANALDLGRRGRLLVASCPHGRGVESPELSTDAELAVALLDRRGRMESWCMARGSRLAIRGKTVCSGRSAEWRSG